MLIYWICNLILFYAIASEGFKNLSPRDWESLNYIAGAWISLVVMFIIAIIISARRIIITIIIISAAA